MRRTLQAGWSALFGVVAVGMAGCGGGQVGNTGGLALAGNLPAQAFSVLPAYSRQFTGPVPDTVIWGGGITSTDLSGAAGALSGKLKTTRETAFGVYDPTRQGGSTPADQLDLVTIGGVNPYWTVALYRSGTTVTAKLADANGFLRARFTVIRSSMNLQSGEQSVGSYMGPGAVSAATKILNALVLAP